ncbi:MAG: membrane protein insertase YidC [Calditrichaeota bacterium]|nr:MAG: membrane protein insertase YidC [Calditrichota bacterium]
MDRKSIFALVLIAVIIILLPYYQKLIVGDQPVKQNQFEKSDSIKHIQPDSNQILKEDKNEDKKEIVEKVKEEIKEENLKNNFLQDSVYRKIEIETKFYSAILSNKGGGSFEKFELKNYQKYDSSNVNLIDKNLNNGIEISFQNTAGENVDISEYLFQSNKEFAKIVLNTNEKESIEYELVINKSRIKKTFIFYADKYHFDLIIEYLNPGDLLLNNQYRIGWENGLPSTESYAEDDNTYNQTVISMGGEVENYDITDEGKKETVTFSGLADWVAIRTKYFLTAITGVKLDNSESIYFSPEGRKKENYIQRIYNVGYYKRYNEFSEDTFRIYMGPLDHEELEQYDNGLDNLVMSNSGYERFFRFFSMIILYIMIFLNKFIPNYGIVIIVFSILIKVVLYPLTKKSYTSMREMQKVQPLMAEIKEKYKGDPQRMNKETMKLYKEHGVNPMGGCLPMLLQMPLLLGLFIVFRSTIQLRGASFIPGWIDDLSRTEALFNLPFSIPFYGDEFNLLPVLMGLTMIFQSKMTMQDPKQKAMVYLMPIMMLFIFNRFPSGLNLYYTLFNLWTIIQQKYLHNDNKVEDTGKKIKNKNLNYKR